MKFSLLDLIVFVVVAQMVIAGVYCVVAQSEHGGVNLVVEKLRVLGSAQERYRSDWGSYGTLDQLCQGVDGEYGGQVFHYLDTSFGDEAGGAVCFDIRVGNDGDGYSCRAYLRESVRADDSISYYVDESCVVRGEVGSLAGPASEVYGSEEWERKHRPFEVRKAIGPVLVLSAVVLCSLWWARRYRRAKSK